MTGNNNIKIKVDDPTRCSNCGILLQEAPNHDCMTVLPAKEVDWGNSEWSITQVS